MTREEKENLLNDFLHEILVKKTVRIEQPLSSNTIAQAVIDYLDKEQKTKRYRFVGDESEYRTFERGQTYDSDYRANANGKKVSDCVKLYPTDWEEVN